MATMTGVNSTLASIANRIVSASGGKITISSGYRSPEKQKDLWAAALRKYGDPEVADNWVARPGTSHHERGLAIDFGGDMQLLAQLAPQFGLMQPMSWEPWHWELSGNVDPVAGTSASGISYNLSYNDGQPANPQEVIANRLHAALRIIGGGGPYGENATMDLSQVELMDSPDMDSALTGGLQGGKSLEEQFSQAAGIPFDPTMPGQAFQASGGKNDPNGYGAYAKKKLASMGMGKFYPQLVALWNRESGDPKAGSNSVTWNPRADNPYSTAYGIAQFLNSTWAPFGPKTPDPYKQIDYGIAYITKRYGNPGAALQFHDRNNWY